MTITYTHEVANARLGGFSSLLLRWKGSVYKLFYKEFIIFISLYTVISIIYRTVDSPDFRQSFEKLCLQFQSYTDLVPISFVLGFYVSMVVGRWWNQYLHIPWPDRVMLGITSNVHGSDNRGRLIRRTLVRYLNLAQVLTYRSISTAVYKRFPTIRHVIDAGFMTEAEFKQYEDLKTEHVKYWVPCVWFSNLLSKVRQEGRIYDDMTYQSILKEMNDFRACCGMLFSYDWISIPLVYTQVVTVAVYVFFMSTLLSRQYLDVTKDYPGHEVDLYVPIFTICQFFFYVGWLKVAEQLINPFGEDDDDFEVNSVIDRNLELSMLTVDNMYLSHPKLEKDIYWNTPNPSIPYTAAAASHKMDIFLGSTIDMSVDPNGMRFLPGDLQPTDETKSETYQMDYNHNVMNVDLKEQSPFLQVPSPGTPMSRNANQPNAPKKPQNVLAASIRKHFMNRALDKEREAKRSLLSMDFLKSRSSEYDTSMNMRKDEIIVEKRKDCNEDEDTMSADADSDDGDSDVGDGSEDDDVNDSISQRRSSLSSEDGSPDNNDNDAPNDSLKSLTGVKHSIGEPEDRPKAKKPKNSSISTIFGKDPVKLDPRLRRPDKLIPNEGDAAKANHRGAGNRGRKSPKKKTTVGKFLKRNEFLKRSGGETEEERRNAQTRTQGLLKISRKKSVQALHRNARRVNYPGNAWLRHRYFAPWGSAPYFNPTDYTSMTSGAEDHGRPGNDSPFGSMLSFGTSIPSPRPLRFSYNAKGGKNLHFDSASMSSCLPSPHAKEDVVGSPLFECYFSPRTRQEPTQWPQNVPSTSAQNPTMSMPFTEDMKRRLLIVNTNTPTSSTATSPAFSRPHVPDGIHQNSAFHGMAFEFEGGDAAESDNLLMIAPSNAAGTLSFSTWRENLEAIGENPAVERDVKKPEVPRGDDDVREIETNDKREKEGGVTQGKSPGQHTPARKATKNREKRNICRSKSCPDVPVSKICDSSDGSSKNPGAVLNDLCDSSEDEVPHEAVRIPDDGPKHATDDKIESFHDDNPAISWENECDRSPTLSPRKRQYRHSADLIDTPATNHDDPKPERKVGSPCAQSYSLFTQDLTGETTPLLLSHESINASEEAEYMRQDGFQSLDGAAENVSPATVKNQDEVTALDRDDNATVPRAGEVAKDAITVETTDGTELQHGPVSADQGYYSAKEEVEMTSNTATGDLFSKIRDVGLRPLNQTGCKALSKELLKASEGENATKGRKGEGTSRGGHAFGASDATSQIDEVSSKRLLPVAPGGIDSRTASSVSMSQSSPSEVVVCPTGTPGHVVLDII